MRIASFVWSPPGASPETLSQASKGHFSQARKESLFLQFGEGRAGRLPAGAFMSLVQARTLSFLSCVKEKIGKKRKRSWNPSGGCGVHFSAPLPLRRSGNAASGLSSTALRRCDGEPITTTACHAVSAVSRLLPCAATSRAPLRRGFKEGG